MLLFYLVLYLIQFMDCLLRLSLSILSLMVYLMLSLIHLPLSRILELIWIYYISDLVMYHFLLCKKSYSCVNNVRILIKIDLCSVKLANLVNSIYKVFLLQLVKLNNPLSWFSLIFGDRYQHVPKIVIVVHSFCGGFYTLYLDLSTKDQSWSSYCFYYFS